MLTMRYIYFLSFFIINILLFQDLSGQVPQNMPQQIEPQTLANMDLTYIKVDQLTDAQIRAYWQRAQKSGLTQEEIETALLARGLSQTELMKLKQRINAIASGQFDTGRGFNEVRTRQDNTQRGDFIDILKEDPEEKIISEYQKKIFGFSLFRREYLTFDPSLNIPTPKNYQLGPGDEVIIDIWGASEQTYQQTITPDGYIMISNLGPLYLNGLSIDRATERLKSRLSKIYSWIQPQDGSRPNTFMQVSLGQVRTIKVTIIGEVETPGTYDISSLATVFNALYLSGGPTVNGSFRQIELIRNNEVHVVLDVYDFLVRGIQKNNILLADQDILRIQPFLNRVEIVGEVKREGIYETLENETFEDLIRFAGGFTENAYKALIKVRRNTSTEKRIMDVRLENFPNSIPLNGDYVIVNSILDRYENRVQIAGAVFREGEYQLTDGMTVLELIEKAEGLTGDAFLERGTIFRTNDDFSTEALAFNLREMLKGEAEDILLQREDLIKVASIYDLREEFYVTIGGSIRSPGNYSYMEGMTVEDLILESGGLLESADIKTVEIARRVREDRVMGTTRDIAEIFNFSLNKDLSIKNEEERFILQPFDNVYIRKSPNYQAPIKIKVEGEVPYPGEYVLEKKDERISDIIRRAGGITEEGYMQGATLIRRTEFYEVPTEIENRYQDLLGIREQLQDKFSYTDNLDLTESERLRSKRLADLEKKAEAYMGREELETSREGARQRRKQLQELGEEDTTVVDIDLKQFESIGIDLEQILKDPGSKYDLILQEGDIISVPKQLQTVRLRGELLYPITVRYDNRYHFKEFIAQAGGFTEEARKGKTYVIYANGSVDRTRKRLFLFNNYPNIDPGAEIIVPQKPKRQPMSAQAWVALSTSIATLALVVERLVSQ
jgi:protein involved in polysaccharide export with SLBB domain